MPTLNELNVFSFDEKVQLTDDLINKLKTLKAIEIIETIISAKLESIPSLLSRLYFIDSRTGSGKSTLMISYLFHKFGKIICSQPRIVLTKVNANDVIRYNPDMSFGENVSVLNGSEKIYAKSNVSCTYCTTQILTDKLYKMIAQNRIIGGYKIVVVDECHVLDSALLTLITIIKSFLAKFGSDRRCPLFIFTSATIDIPMMIKFFFPGDEENIYKNPTMIAHVKGSPNYDVITKFIDPFSYLSGKEDKNMTGGSVNNISFDDKIDELLQSENINNYINKLVNYNNCSLPKNINEDNIIGGDNNKENKNNKKFKKPQRKDNILAELSLSNYLSKNYFDKPDGDCLIFAPLKKTLLTLGNLFYNLSRDRKSLENTFQENNNSERSESANEMSTDKENKSKNNNPDKRKMHGGNNSNSNPDNTNMARSTETRHNLIMFLVRDITVFDEVVEWRNKFRNEKRFIIIPYAKGYSLVADKLLEFATEPDPEARENEYKVIISTPVLETGKTFSNLSLCVDYGLQTTAIYNPLKFNGVKLQCIKQIPANKRQVIQRKGRVGRERPGTFIHYYTENTYNNLPENEYPSTQNNFVMTEVLLKNIRSKYVLHQIFDAMNLNDFIYNISFDIMIRTIHDMIRFGLYSVHGELLNDNIDKANAYIDYYYFIKGYSLFDSIFFVNVHLYDFSDELSEVFTAPELKIELDKLPKQDVIAAIINARSTINKLLYEETFNDFPLIRERLF